ncbi:MAG TPA: hypothetical protein PLV85_23865, partial [Polyangiaceae bacterium]|nr:hypothetical protein [Polyangiaceae bacterium]
MNQKSGQHDTEDKKAQNRRLSVIDEPARAQSSRDRETGEPTLLRVGDLAQETGKTVRAIHLYEEM